MEDKKEGRARGGFVDIGKLSIDDIQPEPFIVYGEPSAPKDGAKVSGFVGTINIYSVKNPNDLVSELERILKERWEERKQGRAE